ncbi:hypothetical protein U0358_12500 [Idiomarina sp. PL1-037]|uniref:hypothetical protein n=1 Tax=Idiomarina sp. PL1-037 TaxID=3095365 RepID=UPI002ACC31E2|nr:hypothetical protein [Idiomarina sp. PL1-037]WQC52839.1 hypothetical protein U0358_12500 [Idiomarina sp. PL1-037]
MKGISHEKQFRVQAGDIVTLSDLTKWKVEGFSFQNEIRVRVKRNSVIRYMAVHKVRDSNGIALIPGTHYLVVVGDSEAKFALRLQNFGPYKTSHIRIQGRDKTRKIGGKVVSQIDYKKFCGSQKAFDEVPETVVIKVGSQVKMRSDFAASHYYGTIEMAGQTGVVESTAKPTRPLDWASTIPVNFNGVRKQYRIHRFINTAGHMMQYGWRYRIERTDDIFTATPIRRIDPDRVEWNDPDP